MAIGISKDDFEYTDKKEETTEEQAVEETKEVTSEESTEEVSEETTQEGKETEQETKEEEKEEVDYVKLVNEKLGRDFKDEEELKKFFENDEKVKALQKELDDNKLWKDEYTKLKEGYKPDKIFANEGIRKMNEVIKKFPDVDPNIALRVMGADVDKMTALDLVILGKQLNAKGFRGGDSAARKQVAKQLDIDEEELNDVNSLSDELYNQLTEESRKYESQFAEMQNMELPDYSDLETEAKKVEEEQRATETKSKEAWSGILDKTLDSFKEYKMYDKDKDGKPIEIYAHTVDDEFKTKHRDVILDSIVKSGLEPGEESFQKVMDYIESMYSNLYKVSIMKGYGKSIETKLKDKEHEEYNVTGQSKSGEAEGKGEKTLPGNLEVEKHLTGTGKNIFA